MLNYHYTIPSIKCLQPSPNSQADDGPTLDKDAFDGLAKAAARKAADDANADPNNPGGTGGSQIHEAGECFTYRLILDDQCMHACVCKTLYSLANPVQTKSTFTKFMQSMLQKSGKIRSLVRELKEKYANCDTTSERLVLKPKITPCSNISMLVYQHLIVSFIFPHII